MTSSLLMVKMCLLMEQVVTYLALLLGAVLASEERHLLHRTVLDPDGRFQVRWGPGDGDDLVFKVEVRTLGYVALGLSPNGGMAGSDVVTGWVKDGEVYFQDRFAEGLFMPRKDDSQDWKLISGKENDTHTILLFRRKLETCDDDDITIDSSTMRMIYAYSDKDPPDEDSVPYHTERGGKSLLLLQPELLKTTDLVGTSHWDVLSPNYTLTSAHSSMYWCTIHKGPELAEKNHVVLIEPLIQKGHERYVHHLVLYECISSEREKYDKEVEAEGHECYHPNMPDVMFTCDGVFAAWGIGGESLVFPDHVGMPLDPSPPKYYLLEVHYDNPGKHDVIQDHSGFRLHYTPRLRRHDAGSLMIGAAVSPRVIIPPGQKEFVVVGHANPECLAPDMPPEGIKIIGVFQHSHLLGRKIKTRHFRNSTELPHLADDSNYDFNYQEYHYFSEEVEFLPEDQITVECTYDSRGRNETTFGGISTREEMCLSFVLYYPRIKRFASVSAAPKQVVIRLVGGDELSRLIGNEKGYDKYVETIRNFDWSKTDLEALEKGLMMTNHNTYCYLGTGEKTTVPSMISYPEHLQEYMVAPSCVEEENLSEESAKYSSGREQKMNHLFLLLTLFLIIC